MNDKELLRRIQNIENKLGLDKGAQGFYSSYLDSCSKLPLTLNLMLVSENFMFLQHLDKSLSDLPDDYEVTGINYERKYDIPFKWVKMGDDWALDIIGDIIWVNSTIRTKGALIYVDNEDGSTELVSYISFNAIEESIKGDLKIIKI